MVAAIADLIRVKIPSSYEVSGGPWPHSSLGTHKALAHGLEQRPVQTHGAEQMNSHAGVQHLQNQHLLKSELFCTT